MITIRSLYNINQKSYSAIFFPTRHLQFRIDTKYTSSRDFTQSASASLSVFSCAKTFVVERVKISVPRSRSVCGCYNFKMCLVAVYPYSNGSRISTLYSTPGYLVALSCKKKNGEQSLKSIFLCVFCVHFTLLLMLYFATKRFAVCNRCIRVNFCFSYVLRYLKCLKFNSCFPPNFCSDKIPYKTMQNE